MSLEETLAVVLCDAFWETCEYRERWNTISENKREVFRIQARRAIEAARKYRQQKTPQA